MDPAWIVVVFVLFAAFAVVAVVLSIRAERKRQEELAALAEQLGLRFDPGVDHDHDDEYAQFEIFRRGHSRVAKNSLYGDVDLFGQPCRVLMGDFRYKVTSSNGKRRRTSTHHFSYLIVHPPWHTPPLLVRPEGMFDKLKSMFGFDDIDFESDEFSRKFFVKSTDKRFAYDVLHPRMMEFLLRTKPPMIDIEHGALCLSDGRGRWRPERFQEELAFLAEFGELWPRHLVQQLER